MESEHISKDMLSKLVAGKATLDQSQIEHLRDCDECMQIIREQVGEELSNGATNCE
jgi:hypothetical protein